MSRIVGLWALVLLLGWSGTGELRGQVFEPSGDPEALVPGDLSEPRPADPDYRVVYWYDRRDPGGTFRSNTYASGTWKGSEPAVVRWIEQMKQRPEMVAYVKEVYLALELGATDQEKLGAVIERERLRRVNTRRFRPGDRLMIGVLEALPGRPLDQVLCDVQPDGTISLDWYGELHVAGLNRAEVKEKLVKHLQRWLNEEVLGLVGPVFDPRTGEPSSWIRVDPAEVDRVYVKEAPPPAAEPSRKLQELELKLEQLTERVEELTRGTDPRTVLDPSRLRPETDGPFGRDEPMQDRPPIPELPPDEGNPFELDVPGRNDGEVPPAPGPTSPFEPGTPAPAGGTPRG